MNNSLDWVIYHYVLTYKANNRFQKRRFGSEEEAINFIRLVRERYFIESIKLEKVLYAEGMESFLGRS